jgi:hypothetical protein
MSRELGTRENSERFVTAVWESHAATVLLDDPCRSQTRRDTLTEAELTTGTGRSDGCGKD